jgi:hypothetical protein
MSTKKVEVFCINCVNVSCPIDIYTCRIKKDVKIKSPIFGEIIEEQIESCNIKNQHYNCKDYKEKIKRR